MDEIYLNGGSFGSTQSDGYTLDYNKTCCECGRDFNNGSEECKHLYGYSYGYGYQDYIEYEAPCLNECDSQFIDLRFKYCPLCGKEFGK